jgi:multiple sugar transport system permease protein
MVEGRAWRKWVYFYIPLTLFVVGTLFPFYWMLVTAFRPDAEPHRRALRVPLPRDDVRVVAL